MWVTHSPEERGTSGAAPCANVDGNWFREVAAEFSQKETKLTKDGEGAATLDSIG